jgi:carbonic anhydrase
MRPLRVLSCTIALLAVSVTLGRGSGSPHWAYEGAEGPQHWAALDHSFETCELGQQQSPVDLKPTVKADLPPIKFSYGEIPTEIVNNGHTLQVNVPDYGFTMRVEDRTYKLVQFHFHTPSEYHIEGQAFPLEVHLVHKDENGVLGVVGVLIKEGAVSPLLEQIFWGGPQKPGQTKRLIDVKTDLTALLPKDNTYYRFMGSLTTPPCSEGVNWFEMREPIEASYEQIQKFRSLFPMNARPLQPLNNRLVVEDIK